MSVKLNQLVAIEKGAKPQAEAALTKAYQLLQKPDLFIGLDRAYKGLDDNDKLPPESKKVQFKAQDILTRAVEGLKDLFNLTFDKETGNTKASADITLEDGTVLVKGAPIPYMLFLEKKLVDLRTLVSKLPTLDTNENWNALTGNSGMFASTPIQTVRTTKISKPVVLYPATEQHPAQTAMVDETVTAGFWTTTKLASQFSPDEVKEFGNRVEAVLRAVKKAREEANCLELAQTKSGEAVLDYIFG